MNIFGKKIKEIKTHGIFLAKLLKFYYKIVFSVKCCKAHGKKQFIYRKSESQFTFIQLGLISFIQLHKNYRVSVTWKTCLKVYCLINNPGPICIHWKLLTDCRLRLCLDPARESNISARWSFCNTHIGIVKLTKEHM